MKGPPTPSQGFAAVVKVGAPSLRRGLAQAWQLYSDRVMGFRWVILTCGAADEFPKGAMKA